MFPLRVLIINLEHDFFLLTFSFCAAHNNDGELAHVNSLAFGEISSEKTRESRKTKCSIKVLFAPTAEQNIGCLQLHALFHHSKLVAVLPACAQKERSFLPVRSRARALHSFNCRYLNVYEVNEYI